MRGRTPWIKDVWDGCRSQPGRTALALFAIAVGVASLTILIAVLDGLQQRSRRLVRELGVNVIAIFQETDADPNASALSDHHADLLQANFPDCTISRVRTSRAPTLGSERPLTVVATDPFLASVRQWTVVEGRWLDPRDLSDRERHAVVSEALGRRLSAGLGAVLWIRDTPFRIVGVVDTGGGPTDDPGSGSATQFGEQAVFVPLSVPAFWDTRSARAHDQLDALYVRTPDDTSLPRVRAAAERLTLQPDLHLGSLGWMTPDVLLRGIRRLQTTIRITAGSVAGLCLVLGGTTLMSLMVANVRDRVPEIGLRMALGATPRGIGFLFVAEACAVTCMAAVAGVGIAVLLLGAGRPWLPVPVRLGPGSVLIPLCTAQIMGIAFAFFPARAAAAILPSEALRTG